MFEVLVNMKKNVVARYKAMAARQEPDGFNAEIASYLAMTSENIRNLRKPSHHRIFIRDNQIQF